MTNLDILKTGKEVIDLEIESLRFAKENLLNDFADAIELIHQTNARVIVCGMGKSGLIGRKIAATLSSTGTPSFFLHPAEAFHGDLGTITQGDILLLISNSGETDELIKIIPFLKNNKNKTIAMTGNKESTLAKNSDFFIDISVEQEACFLQLAPTSSTTVTLALGDALAVTLMKLRNFTPKDFAKFHPGGTLGRKLLLTVKDIMRSENLPIISNDCDFLEVTHAVSKGRLGLTIIKENNDFSIITDGDIRRVMEKFKEKSFQLKAHEFATKGPKTILESANLQEAEELFIKHKISSVLVTNENNELTGILEVYDI